MSEDTGQSIFLNESRELLEQMEEALLQLENNAQDEDSELIAAIFRAAHTIKGTGGVFGFDEVQAFTHIVENVLDKVRAGDLGIDSDLIALLLTSKDHIGVLVEHAVAEQCLPQETVNHGNEILGMLQTYLGPVDHVEEEEIIDSNERVPDSTALIQDGPQVVNDNWHISVRFTTDVLRYGMDPLSFLRYLSRLGDIKHVETIPCLPESLDELNPEDCLIGLEIEFSGDVRKSELEKVFEFVMEECILFILPPRDYIDSYITLLEVYEEESMLGEILVNCGALTEHELQEILTLQSQFQAKNAEGNCPRLGDIAIEKKVVHKEVVDAAIDQQQKVRAKMSGDTRTIRVDADKLDRLVNLVGEMVIAGAGTNLIANSIGHAPLVESMSVMSRLVEEIRDSALRLRMVQIGETFNRFQRVVRDVSRELGKDIKLEINGGETELDKTVVEKIGDPLMHLVRNAMDHGMESNEERQKLGKPAKGSVKLNAYHDSGSIVIEVSDDGRGLNKEKILQKALEKELINPSSNLSDQEIYRLILEPGFSTAEQVTNLSGRGVGMDVVRKNIEALRGSVDIDTELGVGTTMRIRLPLTLAIIDGFLVGVGDSSYVIPLDMINECVEVSAEDSMKQRKKQHINLRGEVLPLLNLRDHFKVDQAHEGRENIVVVQFGGMKAGIVVDTLLGEFQTVIKPLGKIFRRLRGVSGSSILGTGDVAIILDIPGLLHQVAELSNNANSQGAAASGYINGHGGGHEHASMSTH